jgi:hypothetical protein
MKGRNDTKTRQGPQRRASRLLSHDRFDALMPLRAITAFLNAGNSELP